MPGTKRKLKNHAPPTPPRPPTPPPITPLNKKFKKTPTTASTADTVLDTPYSNRSTVSTLLDPEWEIEDEFNDYSYDDHGNILYNGKQVYTSDDWDEPLTRHNQRLYTIIEPYMILHKFFVSKKEGGKRRATKRRRVKRQSRRTTRRTRL